MKRKHLLEKIKSLGGFHVEDLKSKLVSTIMDSLSDEQSKDINHVKIKDDVRRFLSKAQEKYKKYRKLWIYQLVSIQKNHRKHRTKKSGNQDCIIPRRYPGSM